MLETPPGLASILMRHIGAYSDLIAGDIAIAGRDLEDRIWLGTLFVGSSLLATGMLCVGLIAMAWDTTSRLWVIAGLLGIFVLIATVAYGTLRGRRAVARRRRSSTGMEWDKDRLLLARLLDRPGAADRR